MGPEAFETMSYYERWIAAVNRNMVEAGAWSLTELAAPPSARTGARPEEARAPDTLTLPGWSGANQIPLTVNSSATSATR